MSTSSQTPDDQLLVRYLLGSLNEAEAERLDELSITDDGVASQLKAVEHDLVDGFVRRELSAETMDRFRSHYLVSPTRRDKVRFAETLAAYRRRDEPVHVSRGRRIVPWPALAAAALLVLTTSGYLLVEGVRLRSQVAATLSARAALEERERQLQRQVDAQRAAQEDTEKELAQLRALAQTGQRAAANEPGQSAPPPRLRVAAFVLAPATRGIAALPVITARPGTDYVVLQLPLEADEFAGYQATLTDPATHIVWRSGPLNAHPSGGAPTVSVGFPADLLKAQRYSLELMGMPARRGGETVASYPFRVVLE
jgi:hypothetical protein